MEFDPKKKKKMYIFKYNFSLMKATQSEKNFGSSISSSTKPPKSIFSHMNYLSNALRDESGLKSKNE